MEIIDKIHSSQYQCMCIDGKIVVGDLTGEFECPTIKKQDIDYQSLNYIGFQNTRKVDKNRPSSKTVGFFLNDDIFHPVIVKPWEYVTRLGQYKQVLSPDISCYTDMDLYDQKKAILLNRYIGSLWQQYGLTVIPTITWADKDSFDFCFKGVEEGSVVAISTIGTYKHQSLFMNGFIRMCQEIKPSAIICYCKPYLEMYNYFKGRIIYLEYEGAKAKREAKLRPAKGQISIFELLNEEMS